MDKKYQIFVSSTYADLIEERREVMQALLELDCIPAGMELFPAADDDAWTLIARVIDDSDYYMLIVGGRYGSMSAEGASYTEREYDYAVSKGVPVLAFIHSEPDLIPAGKTEISPEAQEKLERFREKVRRKVVKTYTTAKDLGSVVSRSLIRAIKDKPGEGWVRGRYAATPELGAEMSDLRAKLAEAELAAKERELDRSSLAEINFSSLAQGEDVVELHYDIMGDGFSGTRIRRGSITYTWNQLLVIVGPLLLDEASESDMINAIRRDLLEKVGDVREEFGKFTFVNLVSSDFHKVKMQLRALQLITKGTKKRGITDRETYWTLTARGDEAVVAITAIRRDDARPEASLGEDSS